MEPTLEIFLNKDLKNLIIKKNFSKEKFNKKARIAAHSHVKGLGLNSTTGEALNNV